MTTDHRTGPEGPSPQRVFWISCIGTTLEFYDFLAYGIAAALVFNTLFFPAEDPLVGTLLAFATFGAGFLARPIGGVVIGHFGDRLGRRRMLVLTLTIMGASTLLIGLLPTYDSIGVWAPVLLVVLRIVQGFAAGGEWGGAALYGVESAPPGRRGLFGSFTSMGIGLGALLSTLVFTVVNAIFADDLAAWGWRIPFLLGGLLVFIGIVARRGMEDTPEFQTAEPAKLPVVEAIRLAPRQVLLTFGLSLGYNTLAYLSFTFFLAYAKGEGYSSSAALWGQLLYSVTIFVAAPLFAMWSDRMGRRLVIVLGGAASGVFMFIYFPLVGTGLVPLMLLAFAITGPLMAAMQGPLPALAADQFPVHVRYSGMSAGYQIGAALGGGLAPTIATALYASGDHASWPVAVYGAVASVVVIACAALLRESSADATPAVGEVLTDRD
ncbi:MFS transporter [Nonomuraea sp. NPDC005650]|uniref:MFS transporter n=1 Tax=Nonomuraea sp. NPDC005650 TaxID=3157045 RepID=UPI0033AE348F